jgi:hypothetical protein
MAEAGSNDVTRIPSTISPEDQGLWAGREWYVDGHDAMHIKSGDAFQPASTTERGLIANARAQQAANNAPAPAVVSGQASTAAAATDAVGGKKKKGPSKTKAKIKLANMQHKADKANREAQEREAGVQRQHQADQAEAQRQFEAARSKTAADAQKVTADDAKQAAADAKTAMNRLSPFVRTARSAAGAASRAGTLTEAGTALVTAVQAADDAEAALRADATERERAVVAQAREFADLAELWVQVMGAEEETATLEADLARDANEVNSSFSSLSVADLRTQVGLLETRTNAENQRSARLRLQLSGIRGSGVEARAQLLMQRLQAFEAERSRILQVAKNLELGAFKSTAQNAATNAERATTESEAEVARDVAEQAAQNAESALRPDSTDEEKANAQEAREIANLAAVWVEVKRAEEEAQTLQAEQGTVTRQVSTMFPTHDIPTLVTAIGTLERNAMTRARRQRTVQTNLAGMSGSPAVDRRVQILNGQLDQLQTARDKALLDANNLLEQRRTEALEAGMQALRNMLVDLRGRAQSRTNAAGEVQGFDSAAFLVDANHADGLTHAADAAAMVALGVQLGGALDTSTKTETRELLRDINAEITRIQGQRTMALGRMPHTEVAEEAQNIYNASVPRFATVGTQFAIVQGTGTVEERTAAYATMEAHRTNLGHDLTNIHATVERLRHIQGHANHPDALQLQTELENAIYQEYEVSLRLHRAHILCARARIRFAELRIIEERDGIDAAEMRLTTLTDQHERNACTREIEARITRMNGMSFVEDYRAAETAIQAIDLVTSNQPTNIGGNNTLTANTIPLGERDNLNTSLVALRAQEVTFRADLQLRMTGNDFNTANIPNQIQNLVGLTRGLPAMRDLDVANEALAEGTAILGRIQRAVGNIPEDQRNAVTANAIETAEAYVTQIQARVDALRVDRARNLRLATGQGTWSDAAVPAGRAALRMAPAAIGLGLLGGAGLMAVRTGWRGVSGLAGGALNATVGGLKTVGNGLKNFAVDSWRGVTTAWEYTQPDAAVYSTRGFFGKAVVNTGRALAATTGLVLGGTAGTAHAGLNVLGGEMKWVEAADGVDAGYKINVTPGQGLAGIAVGAVDDARGTIRHSLPFGVGKALVNPSSQELAEQEAVAAAATPEAANNNTFFESAKKFATDWIIPIGALDLTNLGQASRAFKDAKIGARVTRAMRMDEELSYMDALYQVLGTDLSDDEFGSVVGSLVEVLGLKDNGKAWDAAAGILTMARSVTRDTGLSAAAAQVNINGLGGQIQRIGSLTDDLDRDSNVAAFAQALRPNAITTGFNHIANMTNVNDLIARDELFRTNVIQRQIASLFGTTSSDPDELRAAYQAVLAAFEFTEDAAVPAGYTDRHGATLTQSQRDKLQRLCAFYKSTLEMIEEPANHAVIFPPAQQAAA